MCRTIIFVYIIIIIIVKLYPLHAMEAQGGTGFGDVDWIHWAQDRDRWRALVNTVINLRVP
jgi:hypothetical protein